MGFGQMKREANRDRETFGGAGGETIAVTEGREMDERDMEEEQGVEEVEKVWTKGK